MRLTDRLSERTRFLGREEELAALRGLVDSGARVITVWGPGGAGKTRIALELGRGCIDGFGGGVWFCDVSAAQEPDELGAAVARAASLPTDGEGDLAGVLAAWLRSRGRALLVLDNCEQLSVAARAEIDRWVTASPDVTFIFTSRETLGLSAERPFALGSLSRTDAVALFRDRGAVWDHRLAHGEPDAVILSLVTAVECLPLSLELLAARLDVLTPAELLAGVSQHLASASVSHGPASHGLRTLDSTLSWSWGLLNDTERAFAESLSVFRGGFSMRDAAILVEGGDAAALLGSLRRKSLLRVFDGEGGESRYALYGLVRDFAAAKLGAGDRRGAAEAVHGQWFAKRAEEWLSRYQGPLESGALGEAERDRENLLAAHGRISDTSPALAATILLCLQPLFVTRGPAEQHLPRLDAWLLAHGKSAALAEVAQRVRLARGELRRLRGEFLAAASDFEEAHRWATDQQDLRLAAQSLLAWAMVENAKDDIAAVVVRTRQALRYARLGKDPVLVAQCLGALGAVHQRRGQLRRAIGSHAKALSALRRSGSQRLQGIELSYLAVATHRLGEVATAEGLHTEALTLDRALDHRRFESVELSHLGYLHHEMGKLAEGRDLFHAALRNFREVGDVFLESVALTFLGRLEVDAASGDARNVLERALAFHVQSGHPRLTATTLAEVGHLCRDRGDLEGARGYFARALATSNEAYVGFETLLPAYLGEVTAKLGDGAAAQPLFEDALTAARAHENPAYALAAALLQGTSSVDAVRVRALAPTSSALRRALRLSRMIVPAPSTLRLTVARDGTWTAREDGARVDLTRRRAVRLVLLALTEAAVDHPGEAMSWEAVLAAGWPGDRSVGDSALKRVYTAIWTLRSLGLEGILVTRGDGYLLDPACDVRWAS